MERPENRTIDYALLENAARKFAVMVRAMQAQCCIASLLLAVCLYCLHRRVFTRYRLGCVLIIRWNCVADLACLLNRAAFATINGHPDLLSDSRHLMAWVCKLYHLLDNLTMNMQCWLLMLFALERAAVSISCRFGLKHFSQFRLKIGAAVAVVVSLASHVNHIWMFGIYSHQADSGVNGTEHRKNYDCEVTPDFHTIYHVVAIAELLANVYAPLAVCGASVAVVLTQWVRHGSEKPSQASQAARLDRGGNSINSNNSSNNNNSSSGRSPARLDRFNSSVKLLQVSTVLLCYPPLAFTGLYRAHSIHQQLPVSLHIYPYLENLLLPMKNVLSALAASAFVAQHMAWHRRDRLSSIRRREAATLAGPEEDNIPLRTLS